MLSTVAHAAVLGGIVWAVVFSVSEKLPQVPDMIAFVAPAPVPAPPPPPPLPAATPAKARRTSGPLPTTVQSFSIPAEIPVGIQPESGIDLSGEGEVIGGVEGGIPGGVLGGILGGGIRETPPPLPPAPIKPKRVGGDLQAPALITRVEPEYPGVAVAGKISGTVILEATVDESGAVTDVSVLRSIVLLDKAAIKAVKQWKYQPLMLNGQAVPFILVVTVTFSLR
jgi:protein TonB